MGLELLPEETPPPAPIVEVPPDEPPSGCEPACEPPPEPPACTGDACGSSCAPGYADCDGRRDNGCEAVLAGDPLHCGACGHACSADATCVRGSCESPMCTPGQPGCAPLACAPGLADCDALPGNGCEIALQTNLANCGSCAQPCSNTHGSTACNAGTCAPQCDPGFGDCDANTRNGCERALDTTDACGACGNTCPAADGVAVCENQRCAVRCALTGSFALRLSLPTSWPPTTLLAAGSGNFTFWGLLRVSHSGNALSGTLISCGEVVPDFRAMPLINERYGVTYPDALFDRTPSLPGVSAHATLGDSVPGGTFTLQRTAFLTGARLDDAINDAWPSASAIVSLDSDGDGKPGLSIPYKTGSGYTAPPADSLGQTRAQTGYLAARLVFSLSGALHGCSASSGSVSAQRVEARTMGCRVTGGGRDCNASERDHLDENTPQFQADDGTYALIKVADDASCAMVRSALP